MKNNENERITSRIAKNNVDKNEQYKPPELWGTTCVFMNSNYVKQQATRVMRASDDLCLTEAVFGKVSASAFMMLFDNWTIALSMFLDCGVTAIVME